MNFQIGDRVRWQARTGDPEREGTVRAVIPPNYRPAEYLAWYVKDWGKQSVNGTFSGSKIRNHESYIVVTDPGKRGGKPSAFRPLVKNLKLVKPENKQQ